MLRRREPIRKQGHNVFAVVTKRMTIHDVIINEANIVIGIFFPYLRIVHDSTIPIGIKTGGIKIRAKRNGFSMWYEPIK